MKFLVVGDVCWDFYHLGDVSRKNPEASAPLLDNLHSTQRTGMAANVAQNLRSFGVEVVLDVPPQPWTEKHRYVDRRHGTQLLRVDYDRTPAFKLPQLPHDLSAYTGVLVSDYNKGYITYDCLKRLSQFPNVFIDTKKKDLAPFGPAWVKVNKEEFQKLDSLPQNLLVTLGAAGCRYGDSVYPAEKIEVIDVCGAGDTFLAAFSFAMCSTHDVARSIAFANKCAAISCRYLGAHALQKEEIPPL
jgi:D-glycero-beta-D-manno-heptose-7-phosphate kinase